MNLPATTLHHLLAVILHKGTDTTESTNQTNQDRLNQTGQGRDTQEQDAQNETLARTGPRNPADTRAESAALLDLLAGFRLYLVFLLEQEADQLCGAGLHAHSAGRRNYRSGYYPRKFIVPGIGSFALRIPHLLYFAPRVSICKRAKSRAPEILHLLAHIHANGVTRNEIYALIKIAWTLDLPDTLLVELSDKLTPILETWRTTGAACPAHPRETTQTPAQPDFAISCA